MKTAQVREPWAPLVMVLGLAGFIVMADNWVVSPLLPSIAKTMGSPVAAAGVLIAAYMLPFGLFQLAFGPIADRFGKLPTVTVTLAVFGVVTALGGLMSSLTGLVAVRAATGIFAASTMPVSLALIGDVVPMEHRQRAIGTFLGISFLGQGLSMAVGGTIAAFAGWRWVFIAYGVVALVVMGVLVKRGKSLPSAPVARQASLFAPYRHLLGRWRSLRIYLVALGEGILILGLFSYLGALLADRHGLGPLGVGLSLTAFGVASVIFGRLSGRIAGRVGRVNLIGLALLLGGLAALTLASVANLSLSLVAIFALGAAFMLAHSSILTIATELAAHHRGVAMSLVAFAFMGGGALGTTMAGRVVAVQGFQSYLLIWGIGLVALGIGARLALAGADVRTVQSVPTPAPASDAAVS